MSAQNEPKTRSIQEVVNALDVVMDELGFQLMRLDEHVKPSTESEEDYLPKLREGYKTSQYWLGVLRRYQQGRLDRMKTGDQRQPNESATGAFMDEE